MGLLEGKSIVITGGASGIGQACVERFIDEGALITVGDVQVDRGEDLVNRFPDRVIFVATDVTRESDIAHLVESAVQRWGRLDVMFNNAGAGGDRASLLELTGEGFDSTMALLARSVAFGHKYAARQFIAQGGGGNIISTASVGSFEAGWSTGAYTIAKHAVMGIVRQAVVELAPLGIRSNAICPGITITPNILRKYAGDKADGFDPVISERLANQQPIGRVGRPEDIANAAVFLASYLSAFVVGIGLVVDGGVTAMTQSDFAAVAASAAAEFRRASE